MKQHKIPQPTTFNSYAYDDAKNVTGRRIRKTSIEWKAKWRQRRRQSQQFWSTKISSWDSVRLSCTSVTRMPDYLLCHLMLNNARHTPVYMQNGFLWLCKLIMPQSNKTCFIFNELMQSCGVRRPFCANRFFSQANGWIATKLAHDGPQKSLPPRCAQGQGRGQKSRDTDTFVISRKSLLLAGKWLERYQTCTWWFPARPASRVRSRSRLRSKVT